MALRKNTETATAAATAPAAATTPAFEAPEDIETTTMNNDTPTPTPSFSNSTAVTAAAPTAVASPLTSGTAMKALEWAIPAAELERMSFGVFPRITVGLDGFSRDKDEELGKKIKISVLSWNPSWLVVTGEQNNTEANKLIKSSYDGKTLTNGGGTVEGYVNYLKSEGYDKASVKQYVEMYANILEYQDDNGKTVVVAEEDQEIVQISLSPQSVGQWMRYLLESGLRKARGIEDTNVVVLTQNKKIIGPNKFGLVTFSPK